MSGSESLRAPRLLVLADGVPVAGAFAADVTSTGWHGCDTFSVRVALSADPAMSATFWCDTTNVDLNVQVDAGFGFTSLIQGFADSVELDVVRGVAEVSGRDRSAALIEARTQETFANRTSSEIAALLAGRHGLSASVQATGTPVGRYWQLEHDRITLNQFARATTEWDLLVGLAEREGFDVWVQGATLYFQPRQDGINNVSMLRATVTLNGPPNVSRLRLERAHTLARGLSVTVKSWSSRAAQTVIHTEAQGSGPGAQYQFVLPDLTADDAQMVAQQRLAELAAHELSIVADMPGETSLSAHGTVAVEGTGTIFDRTFQVDEIARTFDPRSGFTQIVRARAAA